MPAKKPLVKKTIKPTSVVVETKKISSNDCCSTNSSCCTSGCGCCGKVKGLGLILIVINTLFLALILWNQRNIEAMRVGGTENFKMVKEIYKTEGFKSQQKQQIQSALQLFSQPEQAAQEGQVQIQPEANGEQAAIDLAAPEGIQQ